MVRSKTIKKANPILRIAPLLKLRY